MQNQQCQCALLINIYPHYNSNHKVRRCSRHTHGSPQVILKASLSAAGFMAHYLYLSLSLHGTPMTLNLATLDLVISLQPRYRPASPYNSCWQLSWPAFLRKWCSISQAPTIHACPKSRGHRQTLWNGSYTLDCSLLISSITFATNSSFRRRSCARAETRKTPPAPHGHKLYSNIIVVFSIPLEYWHLSNLFNRHRCQHHTLTR